MSDTWLQVFGVCCNNTSPVAVPLPAEETEADQEKEEEVDAIVEEFPIEEQVGNIPFV